MPNRCVFCREGEGTTVDHIPPRGFFKKPRPVNTITVPSCEACRVKYADDDEHMRNLLVSLAAIEPHPEVQSDIAPRRDRSFGYAPKNAQVLINKMVKARAGGEVVLTNIFDLRNDPQVDAFFDRVCRGVLYDAAKIPFFEAEFEWTRHPLMQGRILWDVAPKECARKDVGNVFSYLTAPDAARGHYFVNLRFYENFFVVGRLTMKSISSFPEGPESQARPR